MTVRENWKRADLAKLANISDDDALQALRILQNACKRADDLFGTPQGSPWTDKLISASIQWAREIMKKIDAVCGKGGMK